jgi:hypothetical protein
MVINKQYYSTQGSTNRNISKGVYKQQTTIYGRALIDINKETFISNTNSVLKQAIQTFAIRTNKSFYNGGGCLLVLMYTFLILVSSSEFIEYVFKNNATVQGPSFIFSYLRYSKPASVFSNEEGIFKSDTITSNKTLFMIYVYFDTLDEKSLKALVKGTILDDKEFLQKQNFDRLKLMSKSFFLEPDNGKKIDEFNIRLNYKNILSRIGALMSVSNNFPVVNFTIDLTVSNRLNAFVFYNNYDSRGCFSVSERTLDNLSDEAFTNIAIFLKGLEPQFLYSYDDGLTYSEHYPMLAGFTTLNLDYMDITNFGLILVNGRLSMDDVTDLSISKPSYSRSSEGTDKSSPQSSGRRSFHNLVPISRDFINNYKYFNSYQLNSSDYVRK